MRLVDITNLGRLFTLDKLGRPYRVIRAVIAKDKLRGRTEKNEGLGFDRQSFGERPIDIPVGSVKIGHGPF